MQDPIEYLTEDQLVHIVVLLEEDKKTEAIQYIVQHTPLDQQQALEVIAAIVMEHDAALQVQTQGARFSDDVTINPQLKTEALTDSIAVSIPASATQDHATRPPIPESTQELQEKVAEPARPQRLVGIFTLERRKIEPRSISSKAGIKPHTVCMRNPLFADSDMKPTGLQSNRYDRCRGLTQDSSRPRALRKPAAKLPPANEAQASARDFEACPQFPNSARVRQTSSGQNRRALARRGLFHDRRRALQQGPLETSVAAIRGSRRSQRKRTASGWRCSYTGP